MGKLIVIEGLDGSGKATQSRLLCQRLQEQGRTCKKVAFPDYDHESAAFVKLYLSGALGTAEEVGAYAASTFFAVDRVASFIGDWKAEYDSGTVIIANRYTTANAIHQLSKIDDDGERQRFLDWLYDLEFDKLGIPAPDITLFLEVPVEISLGLIKARSEETGREIDIHENADHLNRAYSAALFSAKKLGWTTVHCAKDGSMRKREDIADEIYGLVIDSVR